MKMGLGGLVIVMSAMTWRQCEVWQNSITLWQHQLKYDPGRARWLAYSKLADAYAAAGRVDPKSGRFNHIRMLYQRAITLNPDYPESYRGMGKLYSSAGDLQRGQEYYRMADRDGPKFLAHRAF